RRNRPLYPTAWSQCLRHPYGRARRAARADIPRLLAVRDPAAVLHRDHGDLAGRGPLPRPIAAYQLTPSTPRRIPMTFLDQWARARGETSLGLNHLLMATGALLMTAAAQCQVPLYPVPL